MWFVSSFPALQTLSTCAVWRREPDFWTNSDSANGEDFDARQPVLPTPPAQLNELVCQGSSFGSFQCIVDIVKWLSHFPPQLQALSKVDTLFYPEMGAGTHFSKLFRAIGPALEDLTFDAEYLHNGEGDLLL